MSRFGDLFILKTRSIYSFHLLLNTLSLVWNASTMTVFLSVRKTRKEPNIDRHHETNLPCEDQFTVYLFVCFFVLRTQF